MGSLLIFLAFKANNIHFSSPSFFLLVAGVFMISQNLEQIAVASPPVALPVPPTSPSEPTSILNPQGAGKRF